MDRYDLSSLWALRDSITKDIAELHKLENRERANAEKGASVLRSLSRAKSVPERHVQMTDLRACIFEKQKEYLFVQADLEKQIAAVPDHYVRMVLSLHFVDLLYFDDVARMIGNGIKGGAVQAIVSRYFRKKECPS